MSGRQRETQAFGVHRNTNIGFDCKQIDEQYALHTIYKTMYASTCGYSTTVSTQPLSNNEEHSFNMVSMASWRESMLTMRFHPLWSSRLKSKNSITSIHSSCVVQHHEHRILTVSWWWENHIYIDTLHVKFKIQSMHMMSVSEWRNTKDNCIKNTFEPPDTVVIVKAVGMITC